MKLPFTSPSPWPIQTSPTRTRIAPSTMALDLTPPILLLLDVKIHAKEQPDRQVPEVRRCHGPRNGAEAPDPDQRIPSPRPQFRAVPGPGRGSLGPPDGLH